MRRYFYALLMLPVLLTVVVFGLYLYKFGSITDPALSSLMTEWGQFGDFIGGTLGTYFALLAFCAAWLAVVFQHEQLQLARKKGEIDQLQPLMAYSAEQIDSYLYAEMRLPIPNPPLDAVEAYKMTLHALISACVHMQERRAEWLPSQQQTHAQLMQLLRRSVPFLVIRLQHLARVLEAYRGRGGSADVQMLYRERYQFEVLWIHELGLLSSDKVRECFQPERIAEVLKTAPAEQQK